QGTSPALSSLWHWAFRRRRGSRAAENPPDVRQKSRSAAVKINHLGFQITIDAAERTPLRLRGPRLARKLTWCSRPRGAQRTVLISSTQQDGLACRAKSP